MKVLGAEFKEWYDNHWPEEWFAEEMPYDVEDEDGNFVWPLDKELDLASLGDLGWQGRGECPRRHWSIEEAFLKWKNERAKLVTLVVTVVADDADFVTQMLEADFAAKVTR
jgi:hypothetical protein